MNILFVDANDNPIGTGTKKEAWEKGIAHRVARIFLFNSKGDFLLQKRSQFVDAPLTLDQSAAGHVDEGEEYEQVAYRELEEELGVKGIHLTEIARYYHEQSKIKQETISPPRKRFNAIFTGVYDGAFVTSPREVAEVRWVTMPELEAWIVRQKEDFSEGFLYAYEKFKEAQLH